jgi:hypothetical protein
MAKYQVSVTTPAAAASAAFATIRAGASSRVRLLELGVFTNAATATSVALTRATNTFVPTTSIIGQPYDTGDPTSIANVDTAWSTAPTVTIANSLRRIALPATIGAGVIWTFDPMFAVGPAGVGGLVLWNFGSGAGSALNVYAVWEE